jgi:anti-sigma factor RsiW
LILAAYLDGNLDEAGREAVEAWMVASPEGLELMISARADLGQAPGPAPEDLISRAQGLVRNPVRESAGFGVWLRGLIGFEPEVWRPLAWAGVTAALLVMVSAGGFELGRLGTERLVSTQSVALGDDLEFGLDDPTDDFI